jgi:sugar lactone lactonase YvrE
MRGLVLGVAFLALMGASGEASSANRSAVAARPVSVLPKQPQALAVAPDGTLYAVDTGRDQVLRLVAGGRFVVVAGDGRRGFSGDGGPGVDAELRLSGASGVTVSASGTVYFSDTGNGRVREVLPDGDIETVAGGGHQALPARPGTEIPALSASFGSPAGLAFGPGHQLYVAADFIIRLSSTGALAWVAGSRSDGPGVCGPTSCAVREENFDGASGLAFEGDGTLVVASTNFPGAGFALGQIRPDGHIGDLGTMRGEGGRAPAIAGGPEGSVICAGQIGFYRLVDGGKAPEPMPNAGALGRALGEPFFGGDGVAAGPSGQIYVDTSPLANQTPYAIAELFPSGRVQVIWKR